MPKVLLEDVQGPFRVDRKNIVSEKLKSGDTKWHIPGRFSVIDEVNGNNRRYRLPVWEANLKEDSHLQSLIKESRCYGLLEHPDDGVVTLQSPISHMVVEARLDGNEVVGAIEIIEYCDSCPGAKLRALIERGLDPMVSSRGFGSLVRASDGVDDVDDDYICEGWDIVYTPSCKSAMLSPARESKEMPASRAMPEKPLAVPEGAKTIFVEGLTCIVESFKLTEGQAISHVTVYKEGIKIGESFVKDDVNAYVKENFTKDEDKSEEEEGDLDAAAKKAKAAKAAKESKEDKCKKCDCEPCKCEKGDANCKKCDCDPCTCQKESINGTPPSTKQPEVKVMEKNQITESISRLLQEDPKKLKAKRFAEGLAHMKGLHMEITKWGAEDGLRSYDAGKLHEDLEELETSWELAASEPSAQVQKLTEVNSKLMSVVDAVATKAGELKNKLGEAYSKVVDYKKLVEELTKRGRNWKARAEKLEAHTAQTNKRLKTACEACDIMAQRYKDDMTQVGRRVLELEFAEKLTDEKLQEKLKAATIPADIVALREELTGEKAEPIAERFNADGKPDDKGEFDKEGKKLEAAPAKPAKPVIKENQQPVVTISSEVRGDPRNLDEAVAMVNRLSQSQKVVG